MTSARLAELKILVVEDNRQMAEVVRTVLGGLGVGRVEVVASAEVGWTTLQDESFDALVVDRRLGGSDGLELVRRLRDPALGALSRTAVLMLTGSGGLADVAAARDAGANEYLVKPFTVSALAERLRNMLERPRPFVHAQTYFGPDRRRRFDGAYTGPERRISREHPS